MKTLLVLGAGRSSSSLISYLLEAAKEFSWNVIVGDGSLANALSKVGDSPYGEAVWFDMQQDESHSILNTADVVISLLPPHLHIEVAKLCLTLNKHLLTASYVSDEMKQVHEEALSRNLLFLNECGLDPGIDHMSAVKIIDKVREGGGIIVSFESFTGGLIAPETDPENPWRYKFTWNPRNVVMAGQSTAKYLKEGNVKYIPYQQLFKRTTRIDVPGYGTFEGYANRDSLHYINTYHLQGIKTMLRGTLRNEGFCPAWDVLVQLGCCDDTYRVNLGEGATHADFLNLFLDGDEQLTVEDKVVKQFTLKHGGPEWKRLHWSGFFNTEKIGLTEGTPAQILEHILNKRWALSETDKDMIVMIHRFVIEQEGKHRTIQSSLVVKGEDSVHTAMAKTVGLPLAIAAKLLMQGKIQVRGVVIPTLPEFYNPIMKELEEFGISMIETEH
jgi:saccharopine dehydrogenase-like NADP-dependent oxidoreductase